MHIMDTQGATLEINNQVYPLESATYHQNGPLTQTLGNGMTIAYQGGNAWIVARVQGWDFARVISENPDLRGLLPCVVHLPGASFTGTVYAIDWSKEPPVTTLRIEGLRPIPKEIASPPAASVPEQEIAWSELRSACHRKAWREAWEIVGTDHTGDATPGEVYIFGVARQVRAVTAALKAWREAALPAQTIMLRQVETASDVETLSVRRMMARKIGEDAGWQRIKRVAAWKSQAAAQHDPHVIERRAAAVMRLAMGSGARITVGGRGMTMYERGEAVIVDDPVPPRMISTPGLFSPDMHVGELDDSPLSALLEMQRAIDARAHIARTMPQEIIMPSRAHATLQAHFDVNGGRISFGSDDAELYGDGRGIAGVLNYPFTQNVRIVPQSSDLASDRIYMSREQYTALGGEALDRRTPAKPKPRKKDKRSARHTQRRK